MSQESLLEKLRLSTSIEQKAALVAESLIQDLPPKLQKLAIWCSFFPWFSDNAIKHLSTEELEDKDIQLIVGLPFVEKIQLGYCFHATTRRGLLEKYRNEDPGEIIAAFQSFQEINDKTPKTLESLILILYGYVITNQGIKAEELFIELLKDEEIEDISVFSELNEAEEFCVSNNTGLTPKYWHYRSQLFLLDKNYDAVVDYCNKTLSLDNTYSQAYATRGAARAALSDFDAAFQDVNLAIELHPDSLAYRSRAGVYFLNKDYKKAIFDFTKAIRIDPLDVLGYINRATVYLVTGKQARAFDDLDSALKMTSDNNIKSLIYVNYARAMIFNREWEKALKYLDKDIQLKPSSGAYRRKGDIYTKLDKINEAQECYQMALELDNQNPYAYLGRAKLLLNLGDNEKAIQDLEAALLLKKKVDLVPQNPFGEDEIVFRLWEAYLRVGETKKADEQRNILLRTTDEAQIREILFFCRKYQLFDTLLEMGKKLIEITPLDKQASTLQYTASGYALNCLGQYDAALTYLEKAEKINAEGETIKINIGVSYWCLGDLQESIKHFELANKLLNRRPSGKNFKKSQISSPSFSSERIWVKAILSDPSIAIHALEEHSLSSWESMSDLYDLRDWSLVVKRFPENLPKGFNEFCEHISQLIIELGGNSIYSFSRGA